MFALFSDFSANCFLANVARGCLIARHSTRRGLRGAAGGNVQQHDQRLLQRAFDLLHWHPDCVLGQLCPGARACSNCRCPSSIRRPLK